MSGLVIGGGLTEVHAPELARQLRQTVPGMAHFAATGPLGRYCKGCAHFGYRRVSRNGAGDVVRTTLRKNSCAKFHELTGKHGPAIPPDTEACRHFRPEGEDDMSNYSEKIEREKQKGLYKVADLEGGKEVTHIIDRLMEDVTMFDRQMDLLCFRDTARQLQLNTTNGDTLLGLFGNDPDDWSGHRITLFIHEYKEGKFGVRIRSAEPGNGSMPAVHQSDMDDKIPY
jgi:hypothetical protein